MPFYLTSFQAKDNMPDVPDLPEGDFMNSEHWPRIKHGPPDKVNAHLAVTTFMLID